MQFHSPQQIYDPAPDPKYYSVQKALEFDKYRENSVKEKYKRMALNQAYQIVENKQKNIEEMMKKVHLINGQPTFLPSNDFKRNLNNQDFYFSEAKSNYGNSISQLGNIRESYMFRSPQTQQNSPPHILQQINSIQPLLKNPPLNQSISQAQPINLHPLNQFESRIKNQRSSDVQSIIDQVNKQREQENLKIRLRHERKNMRQKQHQFIEMQERIQEKINKENRIEQSLNQQQSILFQLVQNIADRQEIVESQKQKNDKLMKEIQKFEKQNKQLKQKINNSLLLHLGDNLISKIDENKNLDEKQRLRQGLNQIINGKNVIGNIQKAERGLGQEIDEDDEKEISLLGSIIQSNNEFLKNY